MHRSLAWGVIAVVAIMLVPVVGVLGAPLDAVRADAVTPAAAPPDDEVIVITSAGQLRVDDPYTASGYKPVSWNSGTETGFTVVAGGDFNGDGDEELVAARGSIVKVFDPVVQSGKAAVSFSMDVGSSRNVRLLSTGNFDADSKDEFAFINYIPGSGMQAALQVYDGGANATASEWTRPNNAEFGAMFQDMSVGDFNADGVDDLVLQRNSTSDKQILVYDGRTLAKLADQSWGFDWLAVAGGNISSSTAGDEMALSRSDVQGAYASVLFFRLAGSSLVDMVPQSAYKYYPYFTSVAAGDLNGDGDDEAVLLRDPASTTGVSLYMINPFGASMRDFSVAGLGTGSTAWRLVRTGDTDGDGRDEAVILRSDRYRIYTEPQVDNRYTETTGTFYTVGGTNLPFMALADVDGSGIPDGPTLSVTPTSLSFSLDCGADSPVKQLSITNSGAGSSFAWQAQVIEDQAAPEGSWLLIDKASGVTPGTLNVSVKSVSKGNYTGKIRITTTEAAVQNKTVDVAISYAALCSGFVASPSTLDFKVPWGSTDSKEVTVSSSGPTAWTTTLAPVTPTISCAWLTPSPDAGTTPSSVKVLVNSATAGVGSKRCTIIFSAVDPSVPNSPQYVTVNLDVPDPGFAASPTDITIWQKINETPVTHDVQIIRPKAATSWTAAALPLGAAAGLAEKLANGEATVTADGVVIDGVLAAPLDWLSFGPAAGTTPSTMTVRVVTSTAGTYRGVIVIAAIDSTLDDPVELVYVTGVVDDRFHFAHLPIMSR